MAPHDERIQKALDKIEFHRREALRLMRWVNDADELDGNPPRFGDLADDVIPAMAGETVKPSAFKWRPGAFFGKPFAAAVRMVLEKRAELGRGEPSPVSVDDIHDALTQGSFDFGTTNIESRKNSIRISLGKNSTTFTRLPNSDLFGLAEWYGIRPRKARREVVPGTGGAAVAENDDGTVEVTLPPEGEEPSKEEMFS